MILLLLIAWVSGSAQALESRSLVEQGNALYFQGDLAAALARYESAIAQSSMTTVPWINGAALLEEMGEPLKAVKWYKRASALPAAAFSRGSDWNVTDITDIEILTALGWAEFRAGDLSQAQGRFQEVLQRQPEHAYALLGMARVKMSSSTAAETLKLLDIAGQSLPLLNLISYYRGKAHELLNQPAKEVEAYRQAVVNDSYFTESRHELGLAQMRSRNFNEAWKQYSKILDVEPRHKHFQSLIQKIQPLLTRKTSEIRPLTQSGSSPYLVESAGDGVPLLRVGVGTNSMGKPAARQFLAFSLNVPFWIMDAKTRKILARGPREEVWQMQVKSIKKKLYVEVTDSYGKARLLRREAFLIHPQSQAKGLITLNKIQYAAGSNWTGIADKILRGNLEISFYPAKKSIKIVNVLDLENYTQGVLAAEMPITSPSEALKAQAVVARSHALFIKMVTRRHRKDGYDVCDEQHCQVYAGVKAESPRSRSVVAATRGRIVTYLGKVAHVIYSSNCGGHTQSGRELAGWGDVPYWIGVRDAEAPQAPRSPWELHRWLYGLPPSYCKPSTYVHPAHFRWTRVVSFKDLEEKINRKYGIGRLLSLRPGRRSDSGNMNSLIIKGSKRQVKVTSEMTIRGLLGLGSLRSTMFIFDTEYRKEAGGLKPVNLVLHGGGWGHGVGLCQSGAMGRAEAGQTYGEIIRGYFKGTELGQLQY